MIYHQPDTYEAIKKEWALGKSKTVVKFLGLMENFSEAARKEIYEDVENLLEYKEAVE